MSTEATPAAATTAPRKKQSIGIRLCWTAIGSVANYLLISTPFHYLTAHTQMSAWSKSAVSFALSTTIFFFWNYFVNFRTSSRKRDALPRYIIVTTGVWAVSTLTLVFFKTHNFHHHFSIGGHALDLDVISTQIFLGGFKFLLYHKWAFPAEKRPARNS